MLGKKSDGRGGGGEEERKKQEIVFKDRLKKKHLKSSREGQTVSRYCNT